MNVSVRCEQHPSLCVKRRAHRIEAGAARIRVAAMASPHKRGRDGDRFAFLRANTDRAKVENAIKVCRTPKRNAVEPP